MHESTLNFNKCIQHLDAFVTSDKILAKSHDALKQYLYNYYTDNQIEFMEVFECDYQAVISSYKFNLETYSIGKNINYTPPLEYIVITLNICSPSDVSFAKYSLYFDLKFNMIDDKLTII